MDIFKNKDILPRWNNANPDGIAVLEYEQNISDTARNMEVTADGTGLMYMVHPADEFEEITGAPPVIPAEPGPYPANANPSAMANIKDEKKTCLRHKAGGLLLRQICIAGLPPRIRSMLEDNYSLNHLTIPEMFTQLKQKLVIKTADIQELRAQMSKQWSREVKIETHTAQQLQTYGHLESAGQAPAPMEAVALMFKSFSSTTTDHLDFNGCMSHFLQRWPAIDDQTPENFAASVVVYVNTLMPAEQLANSVRRKAFSAQEVPAAQQGSIAAAAVAAPQQAAGRGAHQGRGGRGGRGGGRGPAAPAPAGQPRPYCHTHGGPAPGQRGHHSIGCNTPGPNHNWDATFINQMGGVAAV